MSKVIYDKSTPEYDAADRSGIEILAENSSNRAVLTFVGLGADFSGGTATIHVKSHNSRRYLALKNGAGSAVTVNLATTDSVVIDQPVAAVRVGVSGIAGATGWKAVLSGIDEPMSADSLNPGSSVQIVAGLSAVGSVPANPPVGVSGVDGSGLKRALLTDAIGQMMTSEQDSAVINASVSAASVLFTVDMANWRSVLLQVTNAGSGCTVTYECSNDQSTWHPVVGQLVNANSATTPSSSLAGSVSTTATQYHFPKRGKYLRARVSVYGSGTVSVSYSLSCAEVSPMIAAAIYGQVPEGTAFSGNPVTIGLECRTSSKTSVSNGQIVRPIATQDGRMVIRPHSIPENEWYYAAASGGIVNTTTAVTIKAAQTGFRNYITSLQIHAEALTNATEVAIRDGAGGTVLWRIKVPATGLPLLNVAFADPLKATTNTLLEVVTLTASGTGAVYFNAQGYIAP